MKSWNKASHISTVELLLTLLALLHYVVSSVKLIHLVDMSATCERSDNLTNSPGPTWNFSYFIPWKKYFKLKNISYLFESSDHQGHSGKMLVPKKFRIHTREKRAKKIHTQTISKISYTFLKDVSYLSKKKQFSKQKVCYAFLKI